jgi:hypothetical protein
MIGWREWVCFPQLNDAKLIAKTDTGARSSALHVEQLDYAVDEAGLHWVKFVLPVEFYPHQPELASSARQFCLPLKDQRTIKNSAGQQQHRSVVELTLIMGSERFDIEVTLTCRKLMKYPMLLGRTALKNRFIVNVAGSFYLGHA